MNPTALPTFWRPHTACMILAASLTAPLAQAQDAAAAQSAAAAAQKNLDQLAQQARERAHIKPLVQVDALGLEADTAMPRLVSIQVQEHALAPAVVHYWQDRVGQAISVAQIQAFHRWFFDMAERQGQMAYARTQVLPASDGDQLRVQILQPRIHQVRVLASSQDLAAQHVERIQARLGHLFQPGMPLDTLALDQALDTACHDLPVELDATLRSVGPELLDLVVTITPTRAAPGHTSSAITQLNSHGLRQYGRAQWLGAVTIGMSEPKSQLSVLGQASEGLRFARADYSALLPAWGVRWSAFGAHSRSHSILGGAAATSSLSNEIGVGLLRLHGGHRDLVFKNQLEIATRHSESHLQATDTRLSGLQDHQIRWRLTLDNERLSTTPIRAEWGVVRGYHPANETVAQGAYTRIDMAVKGQTLIRNDPAWRLAGRLRGQWANRNLDNYNQMALGGVHGVRAYTSADGVGDRGVLGSLELSHALSRQTAISAFYDVGQIDVHVDPLPGTTVNRYTLQGAGLQLQGRHAQWQYTLTWARGLQGYKAWQASHIESRPNQRRVDMSINYLY